MSRFHFFRQEKLDPPRRPFIQLLNWRCWGINIGRYEFGINKREKDERQAVHGE